MFGLGNATQNVDAARLVVVGFHEHFSVHFFWSQDVAEDPRNWKHYVNRSFISLAVLPSMVLV